MTQQQSFVTDDGMPRRWLSPRRLLAIAIVAIATVGATVIAAVIYAMGTIDDAAIASERQRAELGIERAVTAGDTIGDHFAMTLGTTLLLQNAHLAASNAVTSGEIALAIPGDSRFFIWTPRRLGSEAVAALAPMRIATSVLFLVCIGLIVHRLYRLASELETRRAEAHRMAKRDPLTGLDNRLGFDEALAQSFAARRRFGLVLLDLDDFKSINDTLGHGAGDEVLRSVANRLVRAARVEDLVVRLGGDEFAVVRPSVSQRGELDELRHDLEVALAAPLRIGANELVISASLGLALCPDDAMDAETLTRIADMALYRTKRDNFPTHVRYAANG